MMRVPIADWRRSPHKIAKQQSTRVTLSISADVDRRWLVLALTGLWLFGCSVKHGAGSGGGSTESGGILRVILIHNPTVLDPAKVSDVVTGELLENIFEPLVRTGVNNLPEPALASSWDLSTDGKTYTFHLRPEAKFTNGQPLTADDVKYSFERALSPKTASEVAATYFDGILGQKDFVAGRRTDLPGVIVVDLHTLQVTIDRPRAYFLGMLTYPTGYVVCKSEVEKHGGVVDSTDMIGTGPFRLEAYKPDVSVSLVANASYWGGKPKIDRVEEPIILDAQTDYSNFETGQADMWMAAIPFTRYKQDLQANKYQSEYHMVPTAQVDYLVMDPDRDPAFNDRRVRQAFSLAIDRDSIVRLAYSGVARRADGFLPPELPAAGAPPPVIPYDPAKAKQLFSAAGYGPGGKEFPALTLTLRNKAEVPEQACQIIASNLKQNLGVAVNLQEMESGEYFDDAVKGKLSFYYAGWVADYPDPQDFLSTLLISDANLNHYGYRNTQFDALCRQADSVSDQSARAGLYGRANRILMDDVGVLPIAYPPRLTLVQPGVTGWQANLCNILPFTQATKAAK